MSADKLPHADRRTLEAIFRHPAARNLTWTDAAHLIERLGSATREHNGRIVLEVAGHKEIVPEPKGKDMTAEEVERLRKFLKAAGITAATDAPPAAAASAAPARDMLVAIDHREARLFGIEVGPHAEKTLRPYDPFHFLHHLEHRDDENAYRGQRAPEDPAFYEAIAAALAGAARIVVVGHGEGKSNAAIHLEEGLRAKHPDLWKRVVSVTNADLSHTTEPQLLLIAEKALKS